MGFDIIDLFIILIGTMIGVVALAILRFGVKPDQKKNYKKYSSFFLMGGSWCIVGLVLEIIYRNENILDASLFSFGLIFLLAGGLGIIIEYLKKQ